MRNNTTQESAVQAAAEVYRPYRKDCVPTFVVQILYPRLYGKSEGASFKRYNCGKPVIEVTSMHVKLSTNSYLSAKSHFYLSMPLDIKCHMLTAVFQKTVRRKVNNKL